MYAQKLETIPPPPGVIGSLKAGFEAVSSHVILITLPLALDLFLWLGPRLNVSNVLGPVYQIFFDQVRKGLTSPQEFKQLVTFQDLFNEGLQKFNLVSLISRLQTFPVGISSLMAKNIPAETPIGTEFGTQLVSPVSLAGYIFLLVLAGWVVGALYYRWVSGSALGGRDAYVSIPHALFQTMLLSFLWLLFLFLISIPLTLLLAVLTLINPALASIVLFVLVLIAFWLIVPIYFMPFGIFARRQNAVRSVFSSFRMVRFTFPTSAMFVFTVFILTTGLDFLWSVPDSQSWMALIGIAGHAFITTALLAASFVYYRDMSSWLHIVIEQLKQSTPLPANDRWPGRD